MNIAISRSNIKKGASGAEFSESFNNWDDMKNAHKGEITQFVKDNKPKGSPTPKKWFDKSGVISIDDNNVWHYSVDNVTVSYVPKTLSDDTIAKVVKFPDEVLHSDKDIAKFSIGKFTGDRVLDKTNALKILKEEGYDRIPNGYILHHDIESGMMQLVKKDVHEMFSHYGGHYYNK